MKKLFILTHPRDKEVVRPKRFPFLKKGGIVSNLFFAISNKEKNGK